MVGLLQERSGLGRAEREPHRTIYSEAWDEARECVAALPGRLGRVYRECLDYMEAGWAILRPVGIAAEDTLANGGDSRSTYHTCTFIDVEIVDLFRYVAFGRRDRVPGFTPEYGYAGSCEVLTDAEEVQRFLHVLGLAAANPECSALIRDAMAPALPAFDRWVAGVPRMMRPVYASEAREVYGLPPLRWAVGRLRGTVPRRRPRAKHVRR
jgi:hypothetical protein